MRNKIDKGVTLIATDTEVVGDVNFANQLYVNGKVTGNVAAESNRQIPGLDDGFYFLFIHIHSQFQSLPRAIG